MVNWRRQTNMPANTDDMASVSLKVHHWYNPRGWDTSDRMKGGPRDAVGSPGGLKHNLETCHTARISPPTQPAFPRQHHVRIKIRHRLRHRRTQTWGGGEHLTSTITALRRWDESWDGSLNHASHIHLFPNTPPVPSHLIHLSPSLGNIGKSRCFSEENKTCSVIGGCLQKFFFFFFFRCQRSAVWSVRWRRLNSLVGVGHVKG